MKIAAAQATVRSSRRSRLSRSVIRSAAHGLATGSGRTEAMGREKHVITGLVERRARTTSGELKKAELRVEALKADLAAIDACIRMFSADYDIAAIPAKVTNEKNPAILPKGTGSRKALDILRASGEPLSSWDLARRILISLSKDTDERSVLMLAKTIHSSFSRQKNPVVSLDRATWPGKWRLLPP